MLANAHQLLVQSRGLAMPEDAEREVQRVENSAAVRGQPPREVHRVCGHLVRGLRTRHAGYGLQRPAVEFSWLGARREMPEIDLGALEGILWLNIADDRQDGVVRHIVTSEEA